MRTEKILAGFCLFGILLRLLHFPGGNMILILTIGILSMIYFPFGIYFLSGKTFQQQNVGLSIGVGMALSILVVGILFKLMHWPGALAMLIVGLAGVIPLFFVVRMLRNRNTYEERNDYYGQLFLRLSIGVIVGLCLFIASALNARFIAV